MGVFDNWFILLLRGLPVVTGNTGYLNFICPGPEIALNLPKTIRKPGQNKKLQKTWIKPGMLKIYNNSMLY